MNPDSLKMMVRWASSPLSFFKEALQIKHVSNQQRQGLDAVRNLVWAQIKHHHGKVLTREEQKVVFKRGISIMSGKGTGKDFFTAGIMLWFLICFEKPLIPCTGPSAHQMRDVLWTQIYLLLEDSIIKDWVVWQAEKIYLKEHAGRAAFAVARTANVKQTQEEQAKTLDGFHNDHMMIIIEEAASCGDPIFTSLNTTMTGMCNFAVLIFNPTKNSGFAIDTQTKHRDQWICLQWNAEESDRVKKSQIAAMESYHGGKDTNGYRVFVKGLPPKADPGALIPLDWIMDAVNSELEPLDSDVEVFGLDVGAGGDPSVILRRRGPKVLSIEVHKNVTEFSDEMVNWSLGQIFKHDPEMVFVDSIGWGWGVAGDIRKMAPDIKVIDINVAKLPSDSERFNRLRDDLGWRVRELFEKRSICIPNDSKLIAELTCMRYKEDHSTGKIKLEGKDSLKARGIKSINHFDALALTTYYETELLRAMKASFNERNYRKHRVGASSWRTI